MVRDWGSKPSQRIERYLDRQLERGPDLPAFVEESRSVTFEDLERAGNRLANLIRTRRVEDGDRIGVLLPRSIDGVVAMLGSLKAGCVYVPLDPLAPAQRLADMLARVEPAVVVGDERSLAAIAELRRLGAIGPDTPTVALDRASGDEAGGGPLLGVDAVDAQEPVLRAAPTRTDAAAYIMFTSGSTGRPKGPVISHRNVRSFIDWAVGHLRPQPGDRHSWQPPLHFDLTTLDVYLGIAAGAEVHVLQTGTLLPRQIIDFIRDRRLTQWFSVPSAMAYAGQGIAGDGRLDDLRRVLWAGEVMPVGVLRDWMRRAPHARFTNLYGPTETTVASSCFDVPDVPEPDAPPTPIGWACDGEELVILDEAMKPVEAGRIGDIHIGGVGLASGYWRDAEQTRGAFVPDPRPGRAGSILYRTGDLGRPDAAGCVAFVGRRDSQIKSRGYRIELGEIEVELSRVPEIAETAVVPVRGRRFSQTEIGCALSLVPGREVDLGRLRSDLGRRLPAYMLPTHWRVYEALPRNGNGKIDRRELSRAMCDEP